MSKTKKTTELSAAQGSAQENMQDDMIVELSLEELEERAYALRRESDAESLIDTQHTDGSTTNPAAAVEQGLVYTPPTDPPVVPSDDLQGVEIATGFASSMEESDPNRVRLNARIDNNDLDLEDDIATALRYNSEVAQLDMAKIAISVRNGIALLAGTVETEDDIAIVDNLVRDLEGIVDVVNHLEVEASHG